MSVLKRLAPVLHPVPLKGLGAWLARRSDGARLHAGVDLPLRGVESCFAPEGGRIVLTGTASRPIEPHRSNPPGWAGYGPAFVLMEGDSGQHHLLAHLSKVVVSIGQRVEIGDTVSTGGSAVAHVHWEVRTKARPSGDAVVTITVSPADWLEGRLVPWAGQCPEKPVNDSRTPRACRPKAPR